MSRIVIMALLACAACKVVHSTPGDPSGDGGVPGVVTVGFERDENHVFEQQQGLTIPVMLNTAADRAVFVRVRAVPGTAEEGIDYSLNDDELVFVAGQTLAFISVSLVADGIEEGEESFTLQLFDVNGAQLGIDEHVITIYANGIPEMNVITPTNSGTESSSGSVGFRLSEPASETVYATFILGGTATATADYRLSSTEVTFFPGETSAYVALNVVDDSADELDETITVTLTSTSYGTLGAQRTHTYTIRDNDVPPTVSFALAGMYVDESAPGTATWTVRLSAPSASPISVPFTLVPSTATMGTDYTVVTPSPLTFAPGALTASIEITLSDDSAVEGFETFGLELGPPTNATLGVPYESYGYIRDNDCLGSGTFSVCPSTLTRMDSVTLPAELDTSSFVSLCSNDVLDDWFESGHPDACFIFARTIEVPTTIVRGWRPIVLIATESITVSGALDVSSRPGLPGAGAPSAWCPATAGPGTRAGGAGGSFMTTGGGGGAHNNPDGLGGVPASALTAPPTILRAGCSGQVGGDNFDTSSAGHGGGAVYLVAGTAITLQPNAVIDASGGPGVSGPLSAGGSGGGAGGMIVLDAPTITATGAFVVANGGGGAEGSTASVSGTSGSKANPRTPFTAASGGSGTQGGNGGNGFAQGFAAGGGGSANNTNGAGGGGGGAGYIRSTRPLTGASVSPAL